jgi:hypothetical protein
MSQQLNKASKVLIELIIQKTGHKGAAFYSIFKLDSVIGLVFCKQTSQQNQACQLHLTACN